MDETLDKGPIRFLEKHIIKHDRKYNLEIIATEFPNIDKWIANDDIDNELSNEYWTNKYITDSQKTCLLKLRHGVVLQIILVCKTIIQRPKRYLVNYFTVLFIC